MTTIEGITTAEQLLKAPGLGRCELVRGELIMMSPGGFEHGCITMKIAAPLANFVQQNRLGLVAGAETGFIIARDPDTVRAPDVAFVRAGRVPETAVQGFFEGAADLAVEVLSPDDRASQLMANVQDWLEGGCGRVWVVDPRTRTVTVYRSRSEITVSGPSETLSDEELLPGFCLPVCEIFGLPP